MLNTVVKKARRLKPLSWHCGCNPSVDSADQSRVNYCWSLGNVNLECRPRGESVLAQQEAKGLMSGKECVFASFRLSEPHLMTLIVNENSNLWRSLSYLPHKTSLISSHTASTSFCGYIKGDGLEVLADLQTHRRSIAKATIKLLSLYCAVDSLTDWHCLALFHLKGSICDYGMGTTVRPLKVSSDQ